MSNSYIQGITKNQEFTFRVSLTDADGNPSDISNIGFAVYTDAVPGAGLTNTPTQIVTGVIEVVLTASEMNGDLVTLRMSDGSGVRAYGTVTIITGGILTSGGGGGGLTLDTVVPDLTGDVPLHDPTLGELLSFLWQIFRRRGQKRRWENLKKFLR